MKKISIEGKVYGFDQSLMTNKDYVQIERWTGMTTAEWEVALDRGSVIAMTGLVWVVLRQDGQENLAIDDVVFDPAEVEVQRDEEPGKAPEPEADPSPTN